ncbi:T-lymphocyte surface antigen Ly-9-like [Stegastes partitus]|uniref:T-lymphocyte surface antigen Ly-9-like n=1 Tax=Stegastes partitus TaxID=144197 RepID=A0A9Y4NVM7_9TELE|nr:PREDICTED: T-lymphocyte surface antigen Ly-9-like [Stegastes partitus]
MKVHTSSLVLLIVSKSCFVTLLTVLSSSAADVEETLTGSEGGSITLPAPVGELGLLFYKVKTLAVVQNWVLDIWHQRYRDRLLWNRTTGLFTITRLQKDDSGIYTVQSKTGNVFAQSYKLTVYDSASGPAVETVNVTSDSCVLRCAVDSAADITLRWYKDEEMLNQISFPDSLLLTVTEQNLSSSYRCEAGNPAENTSVHVDVKTLCSGLKHTGDGEDRFWFVLRLVLFFLGFGCFFSLHKVTALYIRQRRREGRSAAGSSQTVTRNMENHQTTPHDAAENQL